MNTLQQAAAAMEDGPLDTQKLVRILLESALNAIMDEQADMACEGGANSRNGYRERGLLTPAGKITLRIPKLRCGTYFPDGILERYSRVDKAVAAAVAEMYATGVSTRKVERVAAKLGIERLSASQVSRICERLDAEVAELRSREFSVPMPYLFLDATYVKCRRDNRVQSTAVVTAIAVGADGVRRVVGLSAIDTETYAGWLGFCRDLRKRSRRPSLLRRVLPWLTRRRNFAPSSSVAAPNVRLFLKLGRSRKALLRRLKLRHQRALRRLPLLLLPPLPPRRPPLRLPLFLLLPALRRAT